MLNWWNTYIKNLRKDIILLLIIDLLILLIIEILLWRIPISFTFVMKVGYFIKTLGVSFIASFIFYFVQIHMPETKRINGLYPTIATYFYRILILEQNLLKNFINIEQYNTISEEIIRTGIQSRNISLYDSPLYLIDKKRYADWIEYGINQVQEIDKNWEMIMYYSSYLDNTYLSILARIQNDCLLDYFRSMKYIYHFSNIGKMNGLEQSFISLWHFIKEQEDYYFKRFAPYRQN